MHVIQLEIHFLKCEAVVLLYEVLHLTYFL